MTSIDEHCEIADEASGVSGCKRHGRRGVLLFVLPVCGVFGLAVFMVVYAGTKQTQEFETRAAEARAKLGKSYEAATIEDLMNLAYDEFDIATAALLIEKEYRPDVDVVACRRMIDERVDKFLATLPWGADTDWAIRQLSKQVSDVEVSVEVGHPGMLSSVLLDKEGNCVGFTTFYMAFAARLGIDLRMVWVPGHVFAEYGEGEDVVSIETVRGGAIMEKDYPGAVDEHGVPIIRRVLKTRTEDLAELLNNRGVCYQIERFIIYEDTDELVSTTRQIDLWLSLKDFDLAIQLDPLRYTFYGNRAGVETGLGDLDLAAADYDKAIELEPGQAWLWRGRANLWERRGEIERALADLAKAIELDPDDYESYVTRAELWVEQEEWGNAAEDYTKPKTSDWRTCLSPAGGRGCVSGDLPRPSAWTVVIA